MVPNCVVRNGSFIGKGAVIMPNSFINIGGYCGERTMVDTWRPELGQAAQIGKTVIYQLEQELVVF